MWFRQTDKGVWQTDLLLAFPSMMLNCSVLTVPSEWKLFGLPRDGRCQQVNQCHGLSVKPLSGDHYHKKGPSFHSNKVCFVLKIKQWNKNRFSTVTNTALIYLSFLKRLLKTGIENIMGRCQKTFHNPDKCYLFLIEVFIDEGEWISLPDKNWFFTLKHLWYIIG